MNLKQAAKRSATEGEKKEKRKLKNPSQKSSILNENLNKTSELSLRIVSRNGSPQLELL